MLLLKLYKLYIHKNLINIQINITTQVKNVI